MNMLLWYLFAYHYKKHLNLRTLAPSQTIADTYLQPESFRGGVKPQPPLHQGTGIVCILVVLKLPLSGQNPQVYSITTWNINIKYDYIISISDFDTLPFEIHLLWHHTHVTNTLTLYTFEECHHPVTQFDGSLHVNELTTSFIKSNKSNF